MKMLNSIGLHIKPCGHPLRVLPFCEDSPLMAVGLPAPSPFKVSLLMLYCANF